MWNWAGRGKRVGGVVVRSSGSGEEEVGVDIRRREMEKGGGEVEKRGGGEEASLLIILTPTTWK